MGSFDLWRFPILDPYRLLRPILFGLRPEQAHTIALSLLSKGLGPKAKSDSDPILHTSVCNLEFANPLGLAAGFDKNAEAITETLNFGFGFVEIGTITPRPQKGNPKPRIFRSLESKAVINRLGFNSDGMDLCLRRIKAWHDETRLPAYDNQNSKKKRRGLVGFNIGKNRDSEDSIADYITGYKLLAPYADYVTVNISSPNTPGLRDMQGREALSALLKQLMSLRVSSAQKPIFVKIAPDLTDAQQEDIASVALEHGIDALIIGNTTVTRKSTLRPEFAKEVGGLSGRPLFQLSTSVLANLYKLTQGRVPLIGVGGVSSGADAYDKIRAGASLVQLYSALVFEGPGLVSRIAHELADLLRRDGFNSVSEAVGSKNP